MPAFITIENSYSNEDAIDRLINYILNPNKAPYYYVCGHAVNLLNADSVIVSFKLIKDIYEKKDQRQVRHIIVSFADHEGVTSEDVYWIECAAVDFYRRLGYQALSAVHIPCAKDEKLHFHIAINTVNLYTGSKYSGTYAQSQELFEYLKGFEDNGFQWELIHKYSDFMEDD